MIDGPNDLIGRFVTLRVVTPRDYDLLYRLHVEPLNAVTGRLSGTTINPDEFGRFLWNGVLAQYIIDRRESPAFVGLVTAYNADFRNGHASLAITTTAALENKGWPIEGALLLIRLLFKRFPIRKLYFESLEFNYQRFKSGAGSLFHVEGKRAQHYYYNGEYWDAYTLAVYRETAEREVPRLLGISTEEA
jgi:RimJ/RimL family protein N-acetyltransferase